VRLLTESSSSREGRHDPCVSSRNTVAQLPGTRRGANVLLWRVAARGRGPTVYQRETTVLQVMGYVPQQRTDDNQGLTIEQQKTGPQEVVIYETDDREEANKILRAGGFIKQLPGGGEQWYPASRVVDTDAHANPDTTIRKGQL
jgi:hypothetical protein